MAKIKYDVSNVEVREANYAQPKPGIYNVKIVEANPRLTDGKNDIEVIAEVTDKGEFQGARLWSYVNFGEASAWKLAEFSLALGLPRKGEIDTDKLVGKKCQVKVNASTYEGEYRARLQRWLVASDSVDGSDGGDSEDEGFDDWSDQDLKDELESRDLKVLGRFTRDKAIALLQENVEGDDEEEEPEADDESAEGEDYSDWSLEDLKGEVESRGIGGNISGRKTKEKLIGALEADDAGPNGDSAEDEEEAAPEDDYDEWEDEELVAEIKDRDLEIKGRKTKDKMIAALRADDSEDAF